MRGLFRWIAVVACLALVACTDPPAPLAYPDTFRVEAAKVHFLAPGERSPPFKWLEGPENRFPNAQLGLTRARAARDIETALMQGLGPASRGGARAVTVRFDVYALSLPSRAYPSFTNLTGWLQFTDSRTGEVLVSNVEFQVNPYLGLSYNEVRARQRLSSTAVQGFAEVLALIRTQAPGFLPRP